jgi:hypothetical protein
MDLVAVELRQGGGMKREMSADNDHVVVKLPS